jgi:hypothetical protein
VTEVAAVAAAFIELAPGAALTDCASSSKPN